jgi:hypothetical protein
MICEYFADTIREALEESDNTNDLVSCKEDMIELYPPGVYAHKTTCTVTGVTVKKL